MPKKKKPHVYSFNGKKVLPKEQTDFTTCNFYEGHRPNKQKTQCECGLIKIGIPEKRDLGWSTSGFKKGETSSNPKR